MMCSGGAHMSSKDRVETPCHSGANKPDLALVDKLGTGTTVMHALKEVDRGVSCTG